MPAKRHDQGEEVRVIVAIAESPERPLREVRLGTFWRQDGLRCVLYQARGALELRLYASMAPFYGKWQSATWMTPKSSPLNGCGEK